MKGLSVREIRLHLFEYIVTVLQTKLNNNTHCQIAELYWYRICWTEPAGMVFQRT